MTIRSPNPPRKSVRAVKNGVAQLLAANGRGEALALGGGLGTTRVLAPHASYVLELKDVAEKRGVEAAHPTGWRFLIRTESGVVGVGETSDNSGEGSSRFALLDSASRAELLSEALQRAEQLASSIDDELEVRYLRIPALFSTNVWLHGSHTDVVLPVEIHSKPVGESHLLDAQEYLEGLIGPARDRLEEDDETIGG